MYFRLSTFPYPGNISRTTGQLQAPKVLRVGGRGEGTATPGCEENMHIHFKQEQKAVILMLIGFWLPRGRCTICADKLCRIPAWQWACWLLPAYHHNQRNPSNSSLPPGLSGSRGWIQPTRVGMALQDCGALTGVQSLDSLPEVDPSLANWVQWAGMGLAGPQSILPHLLLVWFPASNPCVALQH